MLCFTPKTFGISQIEPFWKEDTQKCTPRSGFLIDLKRLIDHCNSTALLTVTTLLLDDLCFEATRRAFHGRLQVRLDHHTTFYCWRIVRLDNLYTNSLQPMRVAPTTIHSLAISCYALGNSSLFGKYFTYHRYEWQNFNFESNTFYW